MKKILLFILTIFSLNLCAQDISLTISETTINKLFDAIGTISGEGEYKAALQTTWELNQTRIELLNDSAIFMTKAKVKTHLGEYDDDIIGKVSITYNEKTNLISITVIDAQFEVAVDIGKLRLVLKRIQLADYFKTPFQFNGPASLTNQLSFQMPNGDIKKVDLKPDNLKMKVVQDKIIVTTNMKFN